MDYSRLIVVAIILICVPAGIRLQLEKKSVGWSEGVGVRGAIYI